MFNKEEVLAISSKVFIQITIKRYSRIVYFMTQEVSDLQES